MVGRLCLHLGMARWYLHTSQTNQIVTWSYAFGLYNVMVCCSAESDAHVIVCLLMLHAGLQRIRVVQQNMLLREDMLMMCIVFERSISSHEALQWSLEQWINQLFEVGPDWSCC